MSKKDLNFKKINGLLEEDEYKLAKDYIKNNLNISDDEALDYLYEYVSSNNISVKKINRKDINIGYKSLILKSLFIGVNLFLIIFVSFYLIKNMGRNISILLIIIITLLVIVFGAYFVTLLLDIISKNTKKLSGKYIIITSGSKLYMNYLIKIENETPILISRKIYDNLKDFNYCEIEQFKYSKIIKNIRNIKYI